MIISKDILTRVMSMVEETSAKSSMQIDWHLGEMQGPSLQRSVKRLRELSGLFQDETARKAMDQETIVYSVQWCEHLVQGTEGGLFWGSTRIEPGQVGREYFMTRGHFHAKRDRGEFYTAVQGEGLLLLMDENRQSRAEEMTSGSLHYIPAYTAHRTINTGSSPLIFWACWPSDAGHDYETIAAQNFSAHVVERNGKPQLIRDRDGV